MSRRGQATLELALGTLVLVPVIVFGIHFAEVQFLGLKVQEAAQAGLFDATADKMHAVPNFNLVNAAIGAAGPTAQERYQDREGRSADVMRATLDQVFTQGGPLTVTCGREDGIGVAPVSPLDAAYPGGESGLACSTALQVKGYRLPFGFVDDDHGFAQASITRRFDFVLCSAGVANPAGECLSRYALLLDDWGFAGAEEARECPLAQQGGTSCSNTGYYELARRAYQKALTTMAVQPRAGSALARFTVGRTPIDEGHFYLSFRGSESQFTERLGASHGDAAWETTPWQRPNHHRRSYERERDECWLGHRCP